MASEKKKADENSYIIHPEYKNKFRPGPAKEIIKEVLQSKLEKAQYSMEETQALTKQVADDIKDRLKELNWHRYKIVVQVAIGEQRGQGVRMGSRCFWDSDTDNFASETYSNESLFCVATAYGIYLY
uniref:Dynein light chain n=1 Tax=Alexandrium andersonii TaxID=327968 RepID=A0A6U6Z4C7_9DINO|mmetsp:Transcript_99845/g.223803  ORF Transcript_99845/g.223803 Transcript_99845/m.223803 type:complete len:127 (+) Transcript_99845:98-478(+)